VTGRQCLPASADVRKPDQVKDAVEAAIKKYGKIDFVICGEL
jgi:peroxisomal 2,4-dienoyl-CoA reductase